MASWRSEDEALYQRLQDLEGLSILWRHYAADAPPPHERASGLLHLLRQSKLGEEAIAAMFAGDLQAITTLLTPRDYRALSPALTHHLALFHGALGQLASASALTHLIHAIAAWGALEEEGAYLRALAETIGGDLAADTVDATVRSAARATLHDAQRRALEDAPHRGARARLALTLAERTPELSERGASASLVRIVSELGDEVAERAIEPLEERLDDATASGDRGEQIASLLEIAAASDWASGHRLIDRRFVELARPVSWGLYKAKQNGLLRQLCAGSTRLVDRAAHRVLSDPSELHQAARVAQLVVFRAETSRKLDAQIQAIELALKVCPTHRNARIVGADVFAFRGLERLRGAAPFSRGTAAQGAIEDARRAHSLWPECKRIDKLEEQLARAGRTFRERSP